MADQKMSTSTENTSSAAANVPSNMNANTNNSNVNVNPNMNNNNAAASQAQAMQAQAAMFSNTGMRSPTALAQMIPGPISAAPMPLGHMSGGTMGTATHIPQVQLLPQPVPGSQYFHQFPYNTINQQVMLQNAAAMQAAMQAQAMTVNQLNLAAMQGRAPSVSPKSPSVHNMLCSSSAHTTPQPPMCLTVSSGAMTPGSATPTGTQTPALSGGKPLGTRPLNGDGQQGQPQQGQVQMPLMVAGKPAMLQRQQSATQPIVIGMMPGQAAGTLQPYDMKSQSLAMSGTQQLLTSQSQLRFAGSGQLATSTGQLISQPMFTNQVLQAMANLQQQGIPLAHQPMLQQAHNVVPGQPLYIRAAAPMQQQHQQQQQQHPMATAIQAVAPLKQQVQKVEMPQTAPQPKQVPVANGKQLAAQGKALSTILPSTSKPSMVKVAPSNAQGAKLNVPHVAGKTKPRKPSTKTSTPGQKSPAQVKTPPATGQPMSSPVPSASQPGTSIETGKTPPAAPPVSTNEEEPEPKLTNGIESDVPEATPPPVLPVVTAPSVEHSEAPTVAPPAAPKPLEPKKDPPVEKQRAIVKPHILTHVIEGFIIQEGPEPFPIQRSSLLTDYDSTKVIDRPSDDSASPALDEFCEDPPELFPEDLGEGGKKCEFCGKFVSSPSRRWCSSSCAKRYNVGHSHRDGLFKSSGMGNTVKAKRGRRLGYRKDKNGKFVFPMESGPGDVDDQTTSHSDHGDTSSTPTSPAASVGGDYNPDTDMDTEDKPAPTSWTVEEVQQFIASIAGCASYADEFKTQEIDGQALLLLKEDHLMTSMNMKLGPALKICARIKTLNEEGV